MRAVVALWCLLGAVSACDHRAPDGRAGPAGSSSVAPAACSARPGVDRSARAAVSAGAAGGDLPLPETVDDEPADVQAEACASADPSLRPMQLLRFTFTDGVEGRDPRTRLGVARPGRRLYAHLRLRNRSGRERCVRVIFRVGGKRRSEITLAVGRSWSWRTWAYATLRAGDTGPVTVEVRDDQGALVTRRTIGVLPAG